MRLKSLFILFFLKNISLSALLNILLNLLFKFYYFSYNNY